MSAGIFTPNRSVPLVSAGIAAAHARQYYNLPFIGELMGRIVCEYNVRAVSVLAKKLYLELPSLKKKVKINVSQSFLRGTTRRLQ